MTAELIRNTLRDPLGLQTALFGRCWPNDSAFGADLAVTLQAGESLHEATQRLDLAWSPRWLLDAGHQATDAGGNFLYQVDDPAISAGPIGWSPSVRLARVDDQIKNDAKGAARRRRLAGEVALAAMWHQSALARGIPATGPDDVRPSELTGNARGARFKNAILYVLRLGLPPSWRVEGEMRLDQIYGLHLRRDVGERSSDIVVFDERDRLIAVISSKWTWRSDRGTEAAQMVPLNRYRPEVPYVVVTAEFPRMRSVARESVEDRAYSLCPEWVAAVLTLRELPVGRSGATEFPTLQSLRDESRRIEDVLALTDISGLVHDLLTSGRRG